MAPSKTLILSLSKDAQSRSKFCKRLMGPSTLWAYVASNRPD